MNFDFQRMMEEASRLTQGGDLQAATASIQAALRGERPLMPDAAEEALVQGSFTAGHYSGPAGSRDYKLFVPPDAAGKSLPLVVMLHGCTQDPDDFAAGTVMNGAALAQPCLVLYPTQNNKANPQRCWNWFKHNHQKRGRGEPALIAGMTREVMQQHGVDARRVYVAGLSAGGAMAAILGAAYPELYAAVGVHSGLPPGAASDANSAFAAMQQGAAGARVRLPPTIVFHGDQDNTVHPLNGERVFAAAVGASDRATEISDAGEVDGRRYTRRAWVAADGRVLGEHWLVHGTGHAWSGGSHRGSHADGRGPSASREMLRFFLEHPLDAAG